jgi:SulP family sulfate permease
VILVLRRVAPRAPGFLLAIILTAVVVTLAGLPVDTIGSRFGGIEAGLPMPSLPAVSLGRVRDLLPSAFTIAFLAGVESLLSAVVAWNMSEMARFRHLLRGPAGDRVVLLVTFGLTVAIEVGVVLASILFMHRMSEVAAIGAGGPVVEMDEDDFARVPGDAYSQRDALPRGVEVFQLRGPLFFGVAGRLSDVIDNVGGAPRVFILRMREVPMVDATGASRLKDFVARAERHGTQVIFSGLQRQPAEVLRQMGVMDGAAHLHLAADFAAAVALARRLVAG